MGFISLKENKKNRGWWSPKSFIHFLFSFLNIRIFFCIFLVFIIIFTIWQFFCSRFLRC